MLGRLVTNHQSVDRDIKPDNILMYAPLVFISICSSIIPLFSDKGGHIKLSDFGLSTGFHKQHDSGYYQRLLEGGNASSAKSTRNSVMVNSINLTMTNKDKIATWKANRRKLVSFHDLEDLWVILILY
jgi:serine/threonine protein kinase